MTTLDIAELEKLLEALKLAVPLPGDGKADVLTRPLDLWRTYLADVLVGLVECSHDAAFKSIQWPNNSYSGDLAVILPRLCPGSKAAEVAFDLLKKFPRDHTLFPLPFVEGVHFRIFVDTKPLARILLPFILDRKESYGKDAKFGLRNPSAPEEGRKKLVVESSSPNVHKEFQGKHLRSTIIGAFVSKFYESMGWDVTRIDHPGDWGKDMALLKVGWEKFGSEEAYEANPVGHLLDVYRQIDERFLPERIASKQARDEAAKHGHDEGEAQAGIENQGIFAERNAAFKKLEEGDEEAVAFWNRVRDINFEHYKDLYGQLGIKFDEYSGESQVKTETMLEVEQMLKDKGICKEGAGAWIIHMQEIGLRSGTAIIRDRTGATTYLLRDLAAVLERSRKYEFDKMIIVAANDNGMHFTHLHHILKALDMADLADKVQHMRFSEVTRMAEELGKGYRPQEIISHCEKAMATALEAEQEKASVFKGPGAHAKALGIAGLLVQELATRTNASHSFDTTSMTAFKRGTGPELQYWYAKLCSVLKVHPSGGELSEEDYEIFLEDGPSNLLRVLSQYPEVTHVTCQSLEPSGLVTYLNSVVEFLADCLSEDDEEGDAAGGAEMPGGAVAAPAGGDKPAAEPVGGEESAAETAGSEEPTTEPAGGDEPAAEPVGSNEAPTEHAGGEEPTAEPTEGEKPVVEPAGSDEPVAEPAGSEEPVTEPRGGDEAPTEPAGGDEPPTEPARGEEPTTEPTGGDEPAAEPMAGDETPTEAAGDEPAAEPIVSDEAPAEPTGGDEPVTEPTAGDSASTEPAGGDEPAAGPTVSDEAPAEPTGGDELATEPTAGDAASTEAAGDEPAAEPTVSDEAPAEPTRGDEPAAEPTAGDSVSTEPAGGDEPAAEPTAGDSASTEPAGGGEPAAEPVGVAGGDEPAAEPEAEKEATDIPEAADLWKKEKEFTPGHLMLFEATRVVLENAMKLLGVTPYVPFEQDRADTPVAE